MPRNEGILFRKVRLNRVRDLTKGLERVEDSEVSRSRLLASPLLVSEINNNNLAREAAIFLQILDFHSKMCLDTVFRYYKLQIITTR